MGFWWIGSSLYREMSFSFSGEKEDVGINEGPWGCKLSYEEMRIHVFVESEETSSSTTSTCTSEHNLTEVN